MTFEWFWNEVLVPVQFMSHGGIITLMALLWWVRR